MWANLFSAGLKLISSGLQTDAAFAQANRIRQETFEKWRRLRRQQLTLEGNAAVVGAASGVDSQSEGLQAVLADMSREQKRQSDWLMKAGRDEATAIDRAATLKYLSDAGQTIFSFAGSSGFGGGA